MANVFMIKKSDEHGFAIHSYEIVEETEKALKVKGKKGTFVAPKSTALLDIEAAKAQLAEKMNAAIATHETALANMRAYLSNPVVLSGVE